jgi:O-antigen ligase
LAIGIESTSQSTLRLPALAKACAWLMLAVSAGVLAAQAPPLLTAALLGIIALAGAALTTPKALLGALLILAPLRTLYLTEAPRLGYPNIPLDIGQWLFAALLATWLLHKIKPSPQARSPHLQSNVLNAGYRWERGFSARAFLPLFAMFVVISLTAFSAWSLNAWLSEWLKWLEMLLLAILVYDLYRDGSREQVILLLVAAGVGNALIGIYQYFGGSGALHLLIAGTDNFRAFGTFGQPNPLGGFMAMTAPLALAGALASAAALWRSLRISLSPFSLRFSDANTCTLYFVLCTFYIISFALLCAALFMSYSRGAWLGFAAACAVMLLMLPRKAWQSALLALVGLGLGVLLLASGRLPSSIVDRLSTAITDIASVQDVRGVDINPVNYAVIERLAHWQAAINMATDSPWLGVGMGNYEVAYAQYRLINWKFPLGHAHNYYLNVLAEAGIIGFITYLCFIISIVGLSLRARQHPDLASRLMAIGILGMWSALAVHSLTDNLYVNNLFMHLSVTIGVLALLNRDLPKHKQQVR